MSCLPRIFLFALSFPYSLALALRSTILEKEKRRKTAFKYQISSLPSEIVARVESYFPLQLPLNRALWRRAWPELLRAHLKRPRLNRGRVALLAIVGEAADELIREGSWSRHLDQSMNQILPGCYRLSSAQFSRPLGIAGVHGRGFPALRLLTSILRMPDFFGPGRWTRRDDGLNLCGLADVLADGRFILHQNGLNLLGLKWRSPTGPTGVTAENMKSGEDMLMLRISEQTVLGFRPRFRPNGMEEVMDVYVLDKDWRE